MQVQLPYGIASISGKIGNTVFYFRNGKQFARRLNKSLPMGRDCRTILEALSSHSRE